MKRIYKYELIPCNDGYVDSLSLPVSAKVLSVIGQENSIYLYALVDTEDTLQKMINYKVYATGQEVDDYVLDDFNNYVFLGTVTLYNSRLVFHVYIDNYNIK